MRRAVTPLLLVALARCGPADVAVGLPPEVPVEGAVLLVVEPHAGEVELYAYAAPEARLEFTARAD